MAEQEKTLADKTAEKSTSEKIATREKTPQGKPGENAAGESPVGEEVKPKIKKSKSKRTVTEGRAYIQSSFNNTIVTITDLNGNVIAWSTAGSNGFKGAKKATPYAAQISAEAAINKALLYGVEKLHVFVKGLGAGREQAIRGLHSSGISIESITDQTPVPHNGCRPRKARRV
jgi:small subunit ribosomal protein S11